MNHGAPWKIQFESHSIILDRPLASISFGQKFGIAALILIGIVCAVRAIQELPSNPTVVAPSKNAPPPSRQSR